LAIETTGPLCSVALRAPGGRVLSRSGTEGLRHLTSLVPMVAALTAEAGMTPTDIGAVAVSAGPGSFTGIRIGVATARALAQALNIPVVKVPTLETFVYIDGGAIAGIAAPPGDHIICPIFDARRSQMYASAYFLEEDGRIMTLVQGGAYMPEDFFRALSASCHEWRRLRRLAAGCLPVRFFGDGTPVFAKAIRDFRARQNALSGIGADHDGASHDMDMDTGIDMDMDMDAGADADTDANTNAGADADTDANTNADANASTNTDTNASTDTDANTGTIVVQDARAVLAWALAQGTPMPYEALEPIYMRQAEAQRKLDEKNGLAGHAGWRLRVAEDRDVYGISVIERLSFGEPWVEKSIRSDIGLAHSDYLVCERDAMVLGYAGLHRIAGEGHITNIAVHPSARRQGVGAAVLRELLRRSEAEGITDFTLEARASDNGAITMYEKAGFRVEGRRKDYYPGREDAVIMWRRPLPGMDAPTEGEELP
jgi:ribosomal-protein-alanine N-acetyltransferase